MVAAVVVVVARTRVGPARGGSDEPVLLTTMTGTDWPPCRVRGPPGYPSLLLPPPRPLLLGWRSGVGAGGGTTRRHLCQIALGSSEYG